MKRWILMIVVLLVPLGFMASAWQAFSHQQLVREVRDLEKRQQEVLDRNRKLLTVLARMESPLVVTDRAREELDMDWPEQGQLRTLRILEGDNGQ